MLTEHLALRYVPYHRLEGQPNVVVDGSPTDGTVLTLTHWPGYPSPPGLEADLSAQMAFAYLAHLSTGAPLHGTAVAASNNHFDQDGLVGLFALTDPAAAMARRSVLQGVAAAGDFAVYTDRRAARASMTVAAYADPDRSPLALEAMYPDRCAQLYDELLGRLPEICDHPERYEDLWAGEDQDLDASERLIRSGVVTVTEYPAEDLAVVNVPEGVELGGGHLFAHDWLPGVHPMAIHNATDCMAVLVRHGGRCSMRYRYETWVQYRSRPLRARRDLTALAEQLTALEPAGAAWSYDGSSVLVPRLHQVGVDATAVPTAVEPDQLVALLRGALAGLPPDWLPSRLAPPEPLP